MKRKMSFGKLSCISKRILLNSLRIVKAMACFACIVITLTSCSQKNSIESGSDETVRADGFSPAQQKNSIESGSVETPSEETLGEETPSEETTNDEDDKIEISMEDVISIGIDEAAKYYDNLQLAGVYSYDNDYDRSLMSGDDGKREWWYVNFANEKNNFVSIMIVDGEVEHVEHYDQYDHNRLIDMDDVNMTSYEAVQKAKDYGLVGGDPDNESHWVSGYNFAMSYGFLVSSPYDYKIFIEVTGISPNGNLAHVYFDATTGEMLLAEEEIEYSNGDVEWKSFN